MHAFTVERSGEFDILRFDDPSGSVNLLGRAALASLEQRLDELERAGPSRTLLIESGKSDGFVAGADVREIASIGSAADGEAGSRRGQSIFARISAWKAPTVALIHGPCVGGGLELALACTLRVASDARVTRLGLPETSLGIIPGFGGTQRLPALIGAPGALALILGGRVVSGREARRLGLVDSIAPRECLREAARRILAGPELGMPRTARARWSARALRIGAIRRVAFARAAASVKRRAGAMSAAPMAALECVEIGIRRGSAAGFDLEARRVGELLAGRTARALTGVFLESQRARAAAGAELRIERASVVGAGQMGAAIAAVLAGAGIRTRLHDNSPAALGRGLARASEILRRRSRGDDSAWREGMDRLEAAASLDGVSRCALVIEAVVEDAESKREVLAALETRVGEDALIATNTSSLSVTALQRGMRLPGRFVGLHFFHPAERMKLVEVVRGEGSGEESIGRARSVARALGKVPVMVADRPGFLVNRLLAPGLLEAECLVREGADPRAVDRALRAAGMAMGPIELLDEIGLVRAGDVLRAAMPGRFEDAGLVRELVGSGALGRKCGLGFYRHERRKTLNPIVRRWVRSRAAVSPEWSERVLLRVVVEAWRCRSEGVVASDAELDLAMVLGAGLLVADGGPLSWARARGTEAVAAASRELARRHGRRFDPPDLPAGGSASGGGSVFCSAGRA